MTILPAMSPDGTDVLASIQVASPSAFVYHWFLQAAHKPALLIRAPGKHIATP